VNKTTKETAWKLPEGAVLAIGKKPAKKGASLAVTSSAAGTKHDSVSSFHLLFLFCCINLQTCTVRHYLAGLSQTLHGGILSSNFYGTLLYSP